uniref:Uncharacterized protein n=1 Tax=Lotus japonicus TaxID=34305 RepID=I3SFB2_LOTJA|nr:unknown [Lotus japonicus]
MQNLRVTLNKLPKLRPRNPNFLQVPQHRDHVFPHTATQHQRVIVDIIHSQTQLLKKLNALPHDINSGRKLEVVQFIRDDSQTLEVVEDDDTRHELLLAALNDAPGYRGHLVFREIGGG